ncbi:RecT family recombinase [Comamonas testosteroni]|uniref:RecT family recombinase n=1 Tax=Comamonas testosteroni TaxID=285 RepID=UPI00265F3E99|nr:RecT family recombinase [Comamonas testosteroni]WKL15967.1 RecT family recombinase [Comamonas testosteroni]
MNAVTTQTSTGSAPAVSTASAGALLMDMDAMDRLERIADIMASGKTTVPQHLRGSKGDCFAISLQSMQWGMNPFAVAQKTHLVNGTLGYEAQLVAAVINNSGLVTSRFQFDWYGPWDKVIGKFAVKRGEKGEYRVPGWTFADEEGCGVRVWATLKGEENPRTLELLLAQARTRNSTLWADDPKQQLAYLAQKRWARLFAPDVILGVYSADELQEPQEIHMGDAVVVEPERATLPVWPNDKWAKQLPSILTGIQGGKTVADALAWLGAKGIVTAEQEKELRTKAKARTQAAATPASDPQEGAPVVDPVKLEADIKACSDLEKLYELGSLIEAVAEPSLQATLTDHFDARAAELEKP